MTVVKKVDKHLGNLFGRVNLYVRARYYSLNAIVLQYSQEVAFQFTVLCPQCEFFSAKLRFPPLLTNYGFKQGDEFKVSYLEEGRIVLEKK